MDPVQDSRFTQNVQMPSSDSGFGGKKLLLGIVGLVLAVLIWFWLANPMVVTVTGTGQVSVPATNATLSFTLSASDASIQGAVTSAQSKADTLRNYLISKGISESDIAQTQVTAVPSGLVTAGAAGFQATISMAAKTVHVTDIGSLISDLYSNGALVVGQPVLSVEDQDSLDQEALSAAMKDAASQAAKIGTGNWRFIRKIVSVSQISSPSTSTSTTKADTLTGANSDIAAQNGVFKIVKAVSVSYKMW
jgi:uncharacterized protein YggE